jgi:hypothetical protein
MQRPQVRQIENQKVESEREIIGAEAEEILKKYGYSQELTSIEEKPKTQKNKNDVSELTFEEIIAKQQEEDRKRKEKEYQKKYGPKPITFNVRNGYDSITKYESDESGIGFKIEITSDMKLPK